MLCQKSDFVICVSFALLVKIILSTVFWTNQTGDWRGKVEKKGLPWKIGEQKITGPTSAAVGLCTAAADISLQTECLLGYVVGEGCLQREGYTNVFFWSIVYLMGQKKSKF